MCTHILNYHSINGGFLFLFLFFFCFFSLKKFHSHIISYDTYGTVEYNTHYVSIM